MEDRKDLKTIFSRQDSTGAVFIFKDIETEDIKELISNLPLFPYIKKVVSLGLSNNFYFI